MKKFGKVLSKILITLAIFLIALISFSAFWTMDTWPNNTADEIMFHITAPVEGTSSAILIGFCLKALLPSILVTAAVLVTKAVLKKKEAKEKTLRTANIISAVLLAVLLGGQE